ncbi:hypothetical protein M9H77_02334 [Catharanthus roseus]|uniref:Uncharacterized protein n=1 Tax=Catharanthus roseus TaxID=4058 RepID=A0ACC0C8A6_CATRO|nr:hypothetical protein M9H77_02334 [Catharanthus roseus]
MIVTAAQKQREGEEQQSRYDRKANGENLYGEKFYGSDVKIEAKEGETTFHFISRKCKPKKSSIVEEFQRAIKLLKVKKVVGVLVEVYVAKDSCDFKRGKSIEEAKESEIKEKEGVERNESLVEESRFFDSISSLFEESENDERLKEEENNIEKSERTKEMSKEKQENTKEELVEFEISEEMNFFASETNSSLVSEVLFVQNFGEPIKNEEGTLSYNSIKIISFFPSNSYLCFVISLRKLSCSHLFTWEMQIISLFLTHLELPLKRNICLSFILHLVVFMKDFIGFATSNQLSFLSGHIEFFLNEHELSNVVESLKTLFENAYDFQFYHSHFKKFMLKKDFENKMGVRFEELQASPCVFVKTILEKKETIVIGIVFDEAVDLFNEKFMPFKSYYTSNAVVQEVQPRFVIDAIKI